MQKQTHYFYFNGSGLAIATSLLLDAHSARDLINMTINTRTRAVVDRHAHTRVGKKYTRARK